MISALLYLLIGGLAAYFGSFVSGGIGALSLGGLLLMGVPPTLAKASTRLASFGAMCSGLIDLYRAKHLPRDHALSVFMVCLVATYIGTSLMIMTPSIWLMRCAGLALAFYSLYMLKRHRKSKSTTKIMPYTISMRRLCGVHTLQFFVSVLSGFIPGMTGSINYLLYTQGLFLSALTYKALSKIIGIAGVLGSLPPILQAGLIEPSILIPLITGMIIGGYIGTQHLLRVQDTVLEQIVLVGIFFMGGGIFLSTYI